MDNQYKSIDNSLAKQIKSDLEENLEKFKDPIILAEMVYRLLEERENTNRILKNIIQKLDTLDSRVNNLNNEKMTGEQQEQLQKQGVLLPETDEQIMQLIQEKGKATAEDIRVYFNYKGKNAASARLNRLCNINLLKKIQVGKKVYFLPNK